MLDKLGFVPDINRLISVLDGKKPDRVPNFEIYVAQNIRSALLGYQCPDGIAGEVEFKPKFGYDFLYALAPHQVPPVYSHKDLKAGAGERAWADNHSAMITDWDSFRAYEYPVPGSLDLSQVRSAVTAAKKIPGKVGVGALMPSAPFTEAYLLFGFEEFCFKLHDDPELVKAVADRIGLVGEEGMQQLCREQIDFVVFGDDMAYTEGMMIAPELMRKLFFPWYRRFIRIAREAGKRVVFHSDGNVEPVIPDFIEAGLNALHPIEPKAMDIIRLKKTYGQQLAFFGNIDVDLLARGKPEQVAAQACKLIASLAPGGGYAIGSSNAVADYVNPENYKAMLMANWRYRP
ncbi:MAG: hypothetical protein KJ964_07810 [Verrucomicrobia bacterium]|nr:hypothetical protein [Verrucomicrobiota bacterium]MBU1735196.1 hypothetical protein [Verrucomicrobiota bacterium]MBU1855818.1 hypothetical protein [Verrucomicrobiota bacterium]